MTISARIVGSPGSAVIGDFDITRIAVLPNESDPVLVVDPYRMLAHPVMLQRRQVIVGRRLQVMNAPRGVEQKQLAAGVPRKRLSVPMRHAGFQKGTGVLASTRGDHGTLYPLRQA